MMLKRLDWDSDFFKMEIAELDYLKIKDENTQNLKNYDLFYLVNCQYEDFSIPFFKLNHHETKVIFTKKIEIDNNKNINQILDSDVAPLSKELFYPLAFESGKHSRFKLDNKFQEKKFKELYMKWVDNSLNKEFADKVFYIKDSENIVGFVTVKKYQHHASIGLIAVDPNIQGKGYGSILVNQVEQYCFENQIFELQIPTQKENEIACKFYKKLGYSIGKEINIKHFWKI